MCFMLQDPFCWVVLGNAVQKLPHLSKIDIRELYIAVGTKCSEKDASCFLPDHCGEMLNDDFVFTVD